MPESTLAAASRGLLEAQKSVLEMIVQNVALSDILTALCRIVEEQASRPVRAALLLVSADGKRLFTGAAPGLPESYCRAVDGIEISPDVGTCAAAAARREIVVTTDISSDPAWRALRHLPLAHGLRAAWSLPIVSAGGAVLGTFGTYFFESREPQPEEKQLVEVLGRTAAVAIERQRADRALRESEARYRAMVEASPECVKLVSAAGTLLQMNAAGLRMLEVEDESEVRGRSVYQALAPEFQDAYRQFNERVCSGNAGTLKFEIITANGARRYMESSSVPLPDGAGGFSHLAITRDISARVAAEAALEKSRARVEYAVRVSGIGFWHWDLVLGELIWDERVREQFFIPGAQRVTLDDFYARLHPEDREATRVAVEKAIKIAVHYDTTYRIVDPASGAIRWIRSVGGAQYDADRKLTYFGGVTVDVTRQQIHEASLLELNERLQEQDRRKDEFLATLAHELRNPLAPLRTGLHILKITTDPVQTERVREMMARQLAHLVRLVDDLLDVSRITLGKVTLKPEQVDFRVVLNAALEATRSLVEARGHDIAQRLPLQAFPLVADPTRLTQVLANLINNAARYTPAGGRIQITAGEESGRLVVRVSDTGVGMEPELLSHVFDMFVQGEPVSGESQGGLGVGLTLVRRLVEMHGGSVEASSQGRGKGSTFVLRLPLVAERGTGAAAA